MKFSINEPCHEDWNKMTPSAKGRHCESCEKQVIDFTNSSHAEIKTYLDDHRGERVCGRFIKTQLHTPAIGELINIQQLRRLSFPKAMALLVLACSLLFSCTQYPTQTLGDVMPTHMDLPIENVIEENVDSVAKELGIDSTDMKLETKAMDSLAKCEFGSDIEMGDVDFVEYNMGEVVEMGMVIDTDWDLDPPPPPPHFDTSFLEGDDNKVYGFAEKMPEFPGGNDSLVSFVRGNLNYPDVLKESGESGRVYVQFVVNQVGVISEVNIVRNFTTHPEVEEEVKRIIASMPLWKAGEINGKKVSVRYTLPLNFKS